VTDCGIAPQQIQNPVFDAREHASAGGERLLVQAFDAGEMFLSTIYYAVRSLLRQGFKLLIINELFYGVGDEQKELWLQAMWLPLDDPLGATADALRQ
jgi:hypothetical protein